MSTRPPKMVLQASRHLPANPIVRPEISAPKLARAFIYLARGQAKKRKAEEG